MISPQVYHVATVTNSTIFAAVITRAVTHKLKRRSSKKLELNKSLYRQLQTCVWHFVHLPVKD